jgi:CHRD domain/PEP-CTERM motif
MRLAILASLILSSSLFGHAAIIEFDLSPPGTDSGIGLHPLNEVIPGTSDGSGNEIGAGISFDTGTRLLTLNIAYGSAFGFSDLTGPAFSWLLHGPSPLGETAPVLFNLQAFHTFAINPIQGGQIVGAVTLDATQEAGLLAGLNYINIYTPENPGGELRGQLVVVPEPSSMLLLGMAVSVFLWRSAKSRSQKSC